MTLREAKKILRSITMACWWKSPVWPDRQEDRLAILREAGIWLDYPRVGGDERKREEVETACKVYYERG